MSALKWKHSFTQLCYELLTLAMVEGIVEHYCTYQFIISKYVTIPSALKPLQALEFTNSNNGEGQNRSAFTQSLHSWPVEDGEGQ